MKIQIQLNSEKSDYEYSLETILKTDGLYKMEGESANTLIHKNQFFIINNDSIIFVELESLHGCGWNEKKYKKLDGELTIKISNEG